MASLSEKAYVQLKEAIIKAEPGTFFSVRKCAAELELSYTPTREALLRLHSEGLLKLVPKVGFFTTQMDLRDITNIYQSRDCIEGYVHPLVLPHIKAEDKSVLYKMIEEQEQALQQGKVELFSEKDVEFHCYIIDLLNNSRLSEFYRTIRNQYRAVSSAVLIEHNMIPLEEHKEFMRLLEKEQYPEAVAFLKEHAENAVKRMREGFVRIGN